MSHVPSQGRTSGRIDGRCIPSTVELTLAIESEVASRLREASSEGRDFVRDVGWQLVANEQTGVLNSV